MSNFFHYKLSSAGKMLQTEDLMIDVVLKRFENPDEVRLFEKGKFEIVNIGGMTISPGTYEPGWEWSQHVSPIAGTPCCEVEHVGMVVSGTATAAMSGGEVYELAKRRSGYWANVLG